MLMRYNGQLFLPYFHFNKPWPNKSGFCLFFKACLLPGNDCIWHVIAARFWVTSLDHTNSILGRMNWFIEV